MLEIQFFHSWYVKRLSVHLDSIYVSTSACSFFFFFNWEQCFHVRCCLLVDPMYCAQDPQCTGPTTSLTNRPNFSLECDYSVGPVHYSRDSNTSFFTETFIKNWSHGTIHTFKNYFVIVFSVFNKISNTQTHPKFMSNQTFPLLEIQFFHSRYVKGLSFCSLH